MYHHAVHASCFFDLKDQQETSKACLGHAKTLDTKRFTKKIGVVSDEYFIEIKKILQTLYLYDFS
jgi:mRNA-degrading endonuclease toxin of MazEF toxin-antitoxin module